MHFRTIIGKHCETNTCGENAEFFYVKAGVIHVTWGYAL